MPIYPLNNQQKEIVRNLLRGFTFTRKQWEYSYHKWAPGGHAWNRTFASGGTDTMFALMWYHHVYKPGSKEWRPKIIMDAFGRRRWHLRMMTRR